MLWSLDMDDFRGAYCGKGRYPLLTAMVTAIADRLPDVSVRMTDTVTWPHPDDVTSPPMTSAPNATSQRGDVPTSSTTTRVPTSAQTSATTTKRTPTTSTPSSTSAGSTSTAVPTDKSTQQVVVITKKSSRGALHLSCRLLLTVAFLVLHLLPL